MELEMEMKMRLLRGENQEKAGRRRPAIFKYGFRFHCCISSAFMKLMSSHN